MQNFLLVQRSSLVYLVGARVGTDISGGPTLLGAIGVFCIELESSSKLLCLTELC